MSDWGRGPSQVEGIAATVSLPLAGAKWKAWALDERGQRGAEVPVQQTGGATQLTLSPSQQTVWWELSAE